MIITTTYHGPTNFKGSRMVAATEFATYRMSDGYDHAAPDAHMAAVNGLLSEILPAGAVPIIVRAGEHSKGYRFLILDGTDTVDAGIAACRAAGVADGSIIVPVRMSCPVGLDAGERVAIAPHLDAYAAGNRFGTVVKVTGTRVRVTLDGGRTVTLTRGQVSQVGTRGHAWDFVGNPMVEA